MQEASAFQLAKEGALRIIVGNIRPKQGVSIKYIASHLAHRLDAHLLCIPDPKHDRVAHAFGQGIDFLPEALHALEDLKLVQSDSRHFYHPTYKAIAVVKLLNEGQSMQDALQHADTISCAMLDEGGGSMPGADRIALKETLSSWLDRFLMSPTRAALMDMLAAGRDSWVRR